MAQVVNELGMKYGGSSVDGISRHALSVEADFLAKVFQRRGRQLVALCTVNGSQKAFGVSGRSQEVGETAPANAFLPA